MSLNDPALAGSLMADGSFGLTETKPAGGGLGFVSDTIATVDEQVIRTAGGTLDFYYRIYTPVGQNLTLAMVSLSPIDSAQLTFAGDASDGPGTVQPIRASALPTVNGAPESVSYYFPITGTDVNPGGTPVIVASPNLDESGTKWLLLRTNATSYTTGTIELSTVDGDAALSSDPAPAFVPAAAGIPEPMTVALLTVAIGALGMRLARRSKRYGA